MIAKFELVLESENYNYFEYSAKMIIKSLAIVQRMGIALAWLHITRTALRHVNPDMSTCSPSKQELQLLTHQTRRRDRRFDDTSFEI